MTASIDRAVARPESAVGRLPDFFVVGHPKSGTSALYRMLRLHPAIYMPDVKEPSFFVPELITGRGDAAKHPQTLEAYSALFAGAGPEQVAGEATPSYLWSQTAAGRIAQVCPDARIIAILREPASFLRSLHLQFLRSHVESEKDLGRALELEPARRRGESLPRNSTRPQLLLYSDHVRYVEQLRRFYDAFSPERVLVLIYDDYRAENLATVAKILRFLDLDDSPAVAPVEVNAAVRVRSPRVNSLIRSLYLGRGRLPGTVKAAIKATTPRTLRRQALRLQRRAQRGRPLPADERLMIELRRRYRDEVVALSDHLNRDLLALWGYERVG
jgi:Sulfotransferase family